MGWVFNAAPRPNPGKETQYPLRKMLSYSPQGWSEGVRKIPPPSRIRSSDHPARSESLYRLRYRGPHCHLHTLDTKINITNLRLVTCTAAVMVKYAQQTHGRAYIRRCAPPCCHVALSTLYGLKSHRMGGWYFESYGISDHDQVRSMNQINRLLFHSKIAWNGWYWASTHSLNFSLLHISKQRC